MSDTSSNVIGDSSSALPQGWEQSSFDEILDLVKGKKPMILGDKSDFLRYPYVNIESFEKQVYHQYTDANNCPICQKNDILIVWDGARCGLIGRGVNGAIGSTLAKINNYGLDSSFLYYFLITQYNLINKRPRGVGIPHVDPEVFWIIDIPIPPLSEQHRIVTKVEELLTQLDAGIASLKKVQTQLKRYRQAVLKAAFEGRLTQEWREQNKVELGVECALIKKSQDSSYVTIKKGGKTFFNDDFSLPPLPDFWVRVRIYDIIEILTDYHANGGYEKLRNNVKLLDEPDYAIMVRATNLEKNDYEKSLKFISESAYHFLQKSKIFGGEVIIGKIGNAGKVYWMPKLNKPCSLGMNLFLLRFKNGILNRYVYFHLLSPYSADEINSKVKGVGNVTIDKQSVRSIHIALPPYSEQLKIIELIDHHFSIIENLERTLNNGLKQAESLRQSILKQAFEGKLVPQNPNDEPASILLERIKAEKVRHMAEGKKGKTLQSPSSKRKIKHAN